MHRKEKGAPGAVKCWPEIVVKGSEFVSWVALYSVSKLKKEMGEPFSTLRERNKKKSL